MSSLITFLSQVRVELGKVTWPTRTQLFQYTAVVIGLSLFFALFLGGFDSLMTWILNRFIVS